MQNRSKTAEGPKASWTSVPPSHSSSLGFATCSWHTACLHKELQGPSLNILTSTQHNPTVCTPLIKLGLASPTSSKDSANGSATSMGEPGQVTKSSSSGSQGTMSCYRAALISLNFKSLGLGLLLHYTPFMLPQQLVEHKKGKHHKTSIFWNARASCILNWPRCICAFFPRLIWSLHVCRVLLTSGETTCTWPVHKLM